MITRSKVAAVLTLGLIALMCWAASPGANASANHQPGKRSAFMRQKLEYAKNVLQGLSMEDYALIERDARALRKLSEASEFEVFTLPNTDYVRFSAEFQNYSSDMVKAAQAKNLDAATLAYNQLVVNCVSCHKYVRLQPMDRFKK